jgi:pimeloyl-ACP methyl ester carboxylesterase
LPTPSNLELDSIRPTYIEAGEATLFAQFHAPAASRPDAPAVLICSPWGPDEVASYRPRRAWAQRLAAAGHPTLRFDLPGVGSSTGAPGDSGLVAAWVGSVGSAAAWMRASAGRQRVVALGLGLGGLLAREAIAAGAEIDDLILWAAPKDGRAFVREMRNFARLQAWNVEEDQGSELPAGWLEVDGLVLSEETVAGLEKMDQSEAAEVPRRALLIGRNTGQAPKAIVSQLEGRGTAVEIDPGGRWGMFVSHPESARLPAEIADSVEAWLAADAPDRAAEKPAERASGTTLSQLELTVDGTEIVERPLAIAAPSGTVFGILSGPASGAGGDCCAVFLNAGGVRDVGPNRMWAERARAWASTGMPAVRLDAVGIGDGGGDPNGLPPGDEHFSPDFEDQLDRVLGALVEEGLGPRFLLVGLCSGAYHGYRTAVSDQRVVAAILINTSVLIWRPGIFSERELRKNVGWLTEGKRVKKFLRGEIGPKRIAEYAVSTAKATRKSIGRKLRGGNGRQARPEDWQARLEAELASLDERGTRVVLAFSKEQGLADELKRTGFVPKMEAMPNLTYTTLPGNDHTLRPIFAQRGLRDLLEAELELVRGRVATK